MILHDLKVGPTSFVETTTKYWEGCSVTGLGLSGEGSELFWHMLCGLPQGVFSGVVDGQIGAFTSSNAPPARMAPAEESEPPKTQ